MKIIARRSKYFGALYIFGFLLMMVYPLIEIGDAPHSVLRVFYLLIAPIALIFLVMAILYFKTPKAIILYDGAYTLYLPRGIKLDAKDVVNVTLRTSNKYMTRKGGALTIETAERTYRFPFVANGEEAVREINNIVYRRKSELGYKTLY